MRFIALFLVVMAGIVGLAFMHKRLVGLVLVGAALAWSAVKEL